MRIPTWLTIAIAAVVLLFGLYRIRLALKPPAPTTASADSNERASLFGSMKRMSRRSHAMVGTIYVLLAAALIAGLFGWKPL